MNAQICLLQIVDVWAVCCQWFICSVEGNHWQYVGLRPGSGGGWLVEWDVGSDAHYVPGVFVSTSSLMYDGDTMQPFTDPVRSAMTQISASSQIRNLLDVAMAKLLRQQASIPFLSDAAAVVTCDSVRAAALTTRLRVWPKSLCLTRHCVVATSRHAEPPCCVCPDSMPLLANNRYVSSSGVNHHQLISPGV